MKLFIALILLTGIWGSTSAQLMGETSIIKYGANGYDNIDDTKAIQQCINEVFAKGGGIVYFPQGTYIISNQRIPGRAICLEGKSNVSLKGENTNTIIKLADGQPDFSRIVSLIGTKNISITNLLFDGNYTNQANPDHPNEHLHGLYMDQVDSVEVHHCNFINTGGDGLAFRGIKNPSMHIYIHDCNFDNNQRNGLTMGSGYRYIRITKCTFGSKIKNSPIDSEPSAGYCGDVLIENNDISTNNLLTVGGYRDSMGSNIIIRNNRMKGSFFIIYARNVLIENNTVENFDNKPVVTVLRENHDIKILNNNFIVNNNVAFYIAFSANMIPENIRIEGNKIQFNTTKDAVFSIKGGEGISIKNNIIKSIEGAKLLADVTSTREMDGFEFSNNDVGKFEKNFSFKFLKNNKIKNCMVTRNKFANKESVVPATMLRNFSNIKISNNN